MAVLTPLADDVAAWTSCEQDALADRWRVYERLREEAPVYRHGSQVFVARYDDASEVLLDDVRFKKNAAGQMESPRVQGVLEILDDDGKRMLREIFEHRSRWISASDDERHTYLRGLGTRIFSPRAIAEMESRIDEVANEMLTALAAKPSADVISELAFHLPLTIISEMLDVPVDARMRIHEAWIAMTGIEAAFNDLRRAADGLAATHAGHMAMERELKAVLDSRRPEPRTELLRALFRAEADEGVSEPDLIGIVSQLITAGHQTTQDLIGNTVFTLLTHRDQWELLCDDPSLVGNAVEEVLRFRSPAQMMSRTAMVDAEVAGEPIAAGEFVVALLGSANHDPRLFDDPESFRIERPNAKIHLSFSRGPHFCLGAALSRLEARTLLRALVRRFPDAELAVPEAEIRWAPSTFLLGLQSLPVTLGPDHG